MKKIVMMLFLVSMQLCCTLDLSAHQPLPEALRDEFEDDTVTLRADQYGNTVLHRLARDGGSGDAFRAIAWQCNVGSIFESNNTNKMALHIAAENGNAEFIFEVIRFAVPFGLIHLVDWCARGDGEGNNFLHLAAQRGNDFYGSVLAGLERLGPYKPGDQIYDEINRLNVGQDADDLHRAALGWLEGLGTYRPKESNDNFQKQLSINIIVQTLLSYLIFKLRHARNSAGQTPEDILKYSHQSGSCLLL